MISETYLHDVVIKISSHAATLSVAGAASASFPLSSTAACWSICVAVVLESSQLAGWMGSGITPVVWLCSNSDQGGFTWIFRRCCDACCCNMSSTSLSEFSHRPYQSIKLNLLMPHPLYWMTRLSQLSSSAHSQY